MGTLKTITAPTNEPITIDEAKDLLRILHSDDDNRIYGMIKAARLMAENFTGQRFMTQTLELSMDGFSGWTIPLNVYPIQSITNVRYDNTASPVVNTTLVSGTDYYSDIITLGGRIISVSGWPSVATSPNSVQIRFVAGYSSADDVPDQIKEGIKIYLQSLYDSEPDLIDVAEKVLWSSRIAL